MSEWPIGSPWAAALLAGGLSALALGLLEFRRGRLPHDHPTDRSLHERPVSRVGGLAIWAGFLPFLLIDAQAPGAGPVLVVAWLAVTGVSVADDWLGVRPALRLGVHAAAAVAVTVALLARDAPASPPAALLLAGALVALSIVWSANLFNFMDGSDGLAAFMAIGGFAAYGMAELRAAAPAQTSFALAGAAFAFLAVNLPPARTFMGDGGSVPLGFLAAVYGVGGIRSGIWPAWFPLLVFLPFVADATLTVLRRLATGAHLFEPHNTHYYQRLHRMGAGHRGTLFFYGVLIAGTCTSALFTLATDPALGWPVLGAWTAVIAALFAGIDHHWRKISRLTR